MARRLLTEIRCLPLAKCGGMRSVAYAFKEARGRRVKLPLIYVRSRPKKLRR
jgi:hypothetical protein